VWAQVVSLVRAGVDWRLGEPERLELAASNERFEVAVPLADEVWQAWEVDTSETHWASIGEVCQSLGVERSSAGYARTAREVARILVGADVTRTRKRLKGVTGRATRYAVRRALPQ